MNETAEYRLLTLGALRVAHGAQEARLSRRKAGSLLAYLALNPGPHSRDELAGLFWGDYTDVDARRSLRTTLSAVRSALSDDVVIAGRESVQINPTFPLWIDARAFEDYARRFLAESSFDLSLSFIDLYGGDLLADSYDDWIIPERERLRSLYVDVLLHAAQQLRSRSEYERAVEFARRVLTIEPANERAHQHLMFCFIALGDRSAALQQYARCERALRADLDVAPMPETRSLHQWIKGQPAHAPVAEARITNLPIPLSSFVGRAREMAEIKRRLTETRLLTLTGPGGSGKTRLAIQVAADLVDAYKDGVWFTDLACVQAPSLVGHTLAQTLGVIIGPGQTPEEAISARLRARRTLLVLDNCEHIIVACAQLAQAVLSACPHVTILATSREPLAISGEVVWTVPPLSTPASDVVPPSLAALAGYEATRLFVQRATITYPEAALGDSDAPAVAAVCRRLDGLPLAVELAAARVRVLSVNQIAERLDERFGLLTAGSRAAPPRQMSLRAAIDWSYDLLSADEQALLRALSLFAGSCSLRAATAVQDRGWSEAQTLDLLARLVQKSLVVVDQDADERRYRLLENIKLYAREQAALAGEKDDLVRRFIAFYCTWSDSLWEETASVVRQRKNTEQPNLRQALRWCLQIGEIERGVDIIETAWGSWTNWGGVDDNAAWVEAIVARKADFSAAVRAKALTLAGKLARLRSDLALAFDLGQQGLAAARDSGDKKLIRWALYWLGRTASLMGNDSLAVELLDQAMQLDREIGVSRLFDAEQGAVLHCHGVPLWLAEALSRLGEHERALSLLEQGLAQAKQRDLAYEVPLGIAGIGRVALHRGDYTAAAARFRESVQASIQYGNGTDKIDYMDLLAAAAAAQGQGERAAVIWGAMDALRAAAGYARHPGAEHERAPAVETARRTLGDQAFDKANAAGQAMSLDEAVAYALST